MSHTYLYMYDNTRYLFLLIRFKYRSLFFNRRFFGESGCKDTTFFQYAKIFFQKIPFRHSDSVVLQRYASEKKISLPAVFRPAKRCCTGQKRRKIHSWWPKSAIRRAKARYITIAQSVIRILWRLAARVINNPSPSEPQRCPFGISR